LAKESLILNKTPEKQKPELNRKTFLNNFLTEKLFICERIAFFSQ